MSFERQIDKEDETKRDQGKWVIKKEEKGGTDLIERLTDRQCFKRCIEQKVCHYSLKGYKSQIEEGDGENPKRSLSSSRFLLR